MELQSLLTEVLGSQNASPSLRRFLPRVLRSLAADGPLTPGQLARLDGWQPDLVEELEEWGARVDKKGTLIAVSGLSHAWTPHYIRYDGKSLHAWCALDTLILPSLLDATLEIESVCPGSGFPISLTVSPAGIERAHPAAPILSVVIPHGENVAKLDSCLRPALVGGNGFFCNRVWFFPDREQGRDWLGDVPHGYLLELEEAWTLAKELWVDPIHEAGLC